MTMFPATNIVIILVLQTFLLTDANPAFHNEMADLRDVMRKEEIQDEFDEPGNFEHHKSMNPSNAIIQYRNEPVQSQGGQSLHIFKKEFPLQTPTPLQPVRSQTGSNKLELIISPEESDVRKAQKTNETFQKLLQFMTIVGQIDEYLKERAQSAIKSIAQIADDAARAHEKDI